MCDLEDSNLINIKCIVFIYNKAEYIDLSYKGPSWNYNYLCNQWLSSLKLLRGHCGRDSMVVGFTTTYESSTTTNVLSSNPVQAKCTRYNIMLSVACDKSVVFSVYSTNKYDSHDIAEKVLKVVLSTITITTISFLAKL